MTADYIKKNLLYWGKDGKANSPRMKLFLSEAGDVVPRSLWPYEEVGSTQEATSEVREMIPETGFSSPKPVRLLDRIIDLSTDPKEEDIILDSFAGSGTTAHAVLALNKEDGGNRKFILVQQPYDSKADEKQKLNICRAITRERVKRVMEGYAHKDNAGRRVKVPGLGGDFTYACVGDVLLDEARSFGKRLPAFEDLARYIFFTETSRPLDPKQIDPKTGWIGELGETSYYLLYSSNDKEARRLDRDFLKFLKAKDKNRRQVVYCEKVWVHRDELPDGLRTMLLPFQIR